MLAVPRALMVLLTLFHQEELRHILIRGIQTLFRQLNLQPVFYPEHIPSASPMPMDVLLAAPQQLIQLAAVWALTATSILMQVAPPVLTVRLTLMPTVERIRILMCGTQILFKQLLLQPVFRPETTRYVLLT